MENVLDKLKSSVQLGCVGDDHCIDDCFDINPSDGLESEYLQTKIYREKFNMVVSQPQSGVV